MSSPAPRAGGYRRLLGWAGLPVTNRRWAAPLSAIALGFGLFVGVAVGPGASGGLATNPAQVIQIPDFTGGAEEAESGGGGLGGRSAAAAASPTVPTPPLPLAAEPSSVEPVPIMSSVSDPPAPLETGNTESGAPQPEGEEGVAEEETLAGVVVHVNPAAGSYTLAEAGGMLSAVHAGKAPRPGTEVEVAARPLANGTFAEAGRRVRSGSRARATVAGIVTHVDPTGSAPAYVVSRRGVSLLVHVRPDPTGTAPVLPALGVLASVTVAIEMPPAPVTPTEATPAEPRVPAAPAAPPSCAPDPAQPLPAVIPGAILWQVEASAEGEPFTYADFAGIVAAVCPETGEISISSDDIREGLHDLVFTVPDEIDTGKLKIGQSVTATATVGEDGTLTLTGLASDERLEGADDAKTAQGDLKR